MKKVKAVKNVKKKTNQNSGFAVASLVLGIIALFPGWGLLFGILALIFGIIAIKNAEKEKGKNKKLAIVGTICGGIGILFTIILYGVFIYSMLGNGKGPLSGPFNEVRVRASQQILTQNIGAIELYKKKFGNYPESLEVARKAGYDIFPVDHFMHPLYYQVSKDGSSYELKSPGPDGTINTSDDVLLPQ